MSLFTRRKFLATTSVGIAALAPGARLLRAAEIETHSASALLPDPRTSAALKNLAAEALAAAKGAGAAFADIRIAEGQSLEVSLPGGEVPRIVLSATGGYGIRAVMGGAIAFAYGDVMTADAVAQTAHHAVSLAKGFAKQISSPVEIATQPAQTGAWISPQQIDPFAVPIEEQASLLGACRDAIATRVEGAVGSNKFNWQRETRIVANSDGTIIEQVFHRSRPEMTVSARWMGSAYTDLFGFNPCMGGYETVAGQEWQEAMKAQAERFQGYARLPVEEMDVGRYPIVMDGHAVSVLLSSTLAPALQLDRIAGFEADASGRSFVTLDAQRQAGNSAVQFSPLLSVRCERPLTCITGAKWDDDGVPVVPVSLIENGNIGGYISDRQTAPLLGQSSNGFAVASAADRPPLVGGGHCIMSASQDGAPLDALFAEMADGLVMLQCRRINTDQQLGTGQIRPGVLLHVKKGKIVSQVRRANLQFVTPRFWSGIDHLGGTATRETSVIQLYKGQPWQSLDYACTAPASRFKEIDLTRIGVA